jgi:hypothetical protein
MRPSPVYRYGFLLVSLAVLVLVSLRCFLVPFSHDEVATFFYYIQPRKFIPFFAHPDANGHFLTNFTSWICFKLFGSSPGSLRIPDLVGAVVLIYAVYRFSKFFKHSVSALVFSAAFIVSYNFMAYFALCRGYGLSMAFLMLSLVYFYAYLKGGTWTQFLKFILFSQIALSANLTLVAVLGILTGILMLWQVLEKKLMDWKNLLAYVFQFGGLLYWIKYGLYLKEAGALYYGAGESYWQVTFVSLLDTLLFKSVWMNGLVLLLFVLMTVQFIWRFLQLKLKALFNDLFCLSYLILVFLILGFFGLKLIAGINYPEDRTGLFFYVFFITSLAFYIDTQAPVLRNAAILIPIAFAVQFILLMNISVHPWRVYETMPQAFYDQLVKEQQSAQRPITIGGHRVREFFYGFQNYNSTYKLNHMTAPEALQMNCDYALAYSQDKPYYANFYTEIASEPYWGFRLLKRKQPIERRLLYERTSYPDLNQAFLYTNFYEKNDTAFASTLPLQADLTFSFEKAHVPLNIYLVMQIDSEDPNEGSSTIRVPFNLIQYDWNGSKSISTSLVSGNLPKKIKRIVVYLWNIDETEAHFIFHDFKLYQLHGKGVDVISKAAI